MLRPLLTIELSCDRFDAEAPAELELLLLVVVCRRRRGSRRSRSVVVVVVVAQRSPSRRLRQRLGRPLCFAAWAL